MKQTTKRLLGITAASVLVIGATTGVFARGGFGPGWGGPGGMHGPFGGRGMMMNADPEAYAEQRLTALKADLDITADQEAAWNTYADAVQAKAGLMAAHRATMHGADTVTPEQRLTFHQQGLEQMQKVVGATRELYAVLTPEQQTKIGGLAGAQFGPRCARR